MKLCHFDYFLKENEKIIHMANCTFKSYNEYKIIDMEGIFIASNMRLLFCNIIGEHPHLMYDYEYKYTTNLQIKGDGEDYLFFKYDGYPVKIIDIKKSDLDFFMNIINRFKEDLNLINL